MNRAEAASESRRSFVHVSFFTRTQKYCLCSGSKAQESFTVKYPRKKHSKTHVFNMNSKNAE